MRDDLEREKEKKGGGLVRRRSERCRLLVAEQPQCCRTEEVWIQDRRREDGFM